MAKHETLGSLFTDIADQLREKGCEPDGFEWETSSMAMNGTWQSVCFGGGKFVSVSRGTDDVALSADGVNWEHASTPNGRKWESVCYGNGKFVAVASESNVAAYSTDGINWTEVELPESAEWMSVCFGSDKFVSVASGGNVAAYSTDGINWTEVELPESAEWSSVCFGGDKFVAVASTKNIAYSTDGINWAICSVTSLAYQDIHYYSVCYSGEIFVAIGFSDFDTGRKIISARSSDGINWVANQLSLVYTPYSVCYGDGMFIAVTQNGYPLFSFDGASTWERKYMGVNPQCRAICYARKKFVVVCSGKNVVYATTGLIADNFPETIAELSPFNIAYGAVPPADTSKLWVPLATKPSNVEISMDSMESAVDSVATKTAVLPTATAGMTSVEIDGKIYIFGGSVSATRAQILVYDPSTDTITTVKNTVTADDGSTTEEDVVMPANSYYASAVAINGKAYIFGGSSYSTSIYEFDPVAGTVTKKDTPLADGVHYTSAVAIKGKAYIFGGQITSSAYTAMIQEYDPATDTCVDTGVDLAEKTAGTAAVAINGKAYIFGGSGYATTIQEYDPSTNKIETKDTVLLDGVLNASAVAINGKAYIFGGQTGTSAYADMIQEYDPTTDTIIQRDGVLASGLSLSSAAVANGKAYIFGGNGGSFVNTIQEYTVKDSLAENHLKLFATGAAGTGEKIAILVNWPGSMVKMQVFAVYVGDADGYAVMQEAYIYDTASAAWKSISGSVYTG